ncbi:hypothetical protein MPSEU_000165700 [Mayamaea pseudoterrestris]|nr:hypothetical protein MPSEU_000165700 [Mayamaea pseudoterrestris]
MTTISSDWKLQFDKDVPVAIHRNFVHDDYMSGAKFLHKVAAIAQVNAHYPSLSLDRRIHKNSWNVVSSVQCHTQVLQGLSANDFHLAMLIDVEVTRPETQGLLLLSEEA